MVLTLGFICRDKEILLGLKKRGFGAGKWTGFGGKLKEGESITDGLKREVKEETGLAAQDNSIDERGIVNFIFTATGQSLEVHVFRVISDGSEPSESEEMKPQWFTAETIPYASMWVDARYWLPEFLAGKKFKARFVYSDDDTVTDYEVKIVDEL